jgi:hypothetical protein
MADELRVDPAFANASRDQLRVLAAEVDDQNGTPLGRGLRESQDLGFRHYAPGR